MTTPAITRTDLLLLGLLLNRPMHGYKVYQQIQGESIDTWFNISGAGVYYSLGKLRDQGLVTEIRQRGGRSTRKAIYRLTDKGRTTFFETLETELACREDCYLNYDLAIYLLNRLPLRRAIPRLEERQAYLAEQVEEVQAALAAEQNDGRSPLKLIILDHKLRFLDMERTWLADVVSGIQENSGALHDQAGQRRGMMVLSGDLRHYHLPDLIRLIVAGQHTGTLTITDGADVYLLGFDAGQPLSISHQGRGTSPAPDTPLDQVLDGLCDCFHRQEGHFSFDQGTGYREVGLPLNLSAKDLILQGCRRVDDWAIIQRLVPSADTIFELSSATQHLEHLTLTPTEDRVVAVVDGVKDVAAIARDLDLTLFEASRAVYCLAAVGVLHTADPDKIHLRRLFRELAGLMCNSAAAWPTAPDERTCEEEVNALCRSLPIRLNGGRIEDQTDPQLEIDELKEMYLRFLREQFKVVSRRFGRTSAHQSFERTLRQLAPELQDVARRYGFERLAAD
jgi:DNA-binding PadR family transcriptional regulator